MRRFIFLIIYIVSTSTVVVAKEVSEKLGRPIMYQRSLERAMKTPKAQHKCHENASSAVFPTTENILSFVNQVNTDYFVADIDCSYRCRSGKSEDITIQEDFRPLELSLYEGDGSSEEKIIWRSLGVTINIWSKEQCYTIASKSCSDGVEDFKVKKITSGDWKLDKKLDCSQQEIIYSPFDEQFKLNNKGIALYRPFMEQSLTTISRKNQLASFFKDSDENDLIQLFNPKECKKKIMVHSCFGDCVWESQIKSRSYTETLATTESLGSDDFFICGDMLEKTLSQEQLSKNVRTFKCEKYVWEFMRKTEMLGSSCAALRVETDCASF